MPKISIGSWAFAFGPFKEKPWTLPRILEYASAAGYDGVELNGFKPHPHPDDYDTYLKCRELVKQVESYGLGISGYGPDFTDAPPALADADDYLKVFRKYLAFCENCGIRTLRVDTVSAPVDLPQEEYEKRLSRLADTWNLAADEAKKSGILFVWEFEPGFWLNKPSEVRRLAEMVGHENFKVLFDTSHAYMGAVIGARQTGKKEILAGGVAEYAALLSDYIGHLHLIDSDGTLHDNETSTHTPFGQGNINFAELLSYMKPSIEKLPWWCIDFCFCGEVESAGREGVPFIKNIIREVL